jgi:hypothetical protein
MVEVIAGDGLMHHVGPFKNRDAAEAWIAQYPPPQCCSDHGHTRADDVQSRERISGLTSV